MIDWLAPRVVWALIGAAALFIFLPDAPDPPDYPRVVVHREVIEALEPEAEIRFVDRIVWRDRPALQVASSPRGGEADVERFCRPLILSRTDTVEVPGPEPTLLLRSGSLEDPFWGASQLRLTGPTSTGGLVQSTHRVRGSTRFVVDGDEVIVRDSRGWWVEPTVKALFWGGLGYLLGG